MRLRKCLRHAFDMVVHSKVRSWLTILGIVIGVASVIAIMSIGSGMQQTMTSQFSSLGGDIITLTAGASRGSSMFGGAPGGGEVRGGFGTGATATEKDPEITTKDVQTLKGIAEISLINPTISGSVEASYLGKKGKVSLTGVDQAVWSRITTLEAAEGRLLDSADTNVIVIGGRLAASYFDKPVGLNQMITVEGTSLRVVGILDDESTTIYLPIKMAYFILDRVNETGTYDSVAIKVKNEDQLDLAINITTDKLMMSRHVSEKTKDFSISSTKQMAATRSQMMSSMSNFLIAIAAVSLIVGAVGIANTMFTSVLEKTKEIGIMKAIGARNRDILSIFLFNAALIGLVGGLLGAFFGVILSGLLPAIVGETAMLRAGTFVSVNSIFLALGASVVIGVIAGAIPAYQASKLKPVDALRFE
jgi:putative ABC transport system permease protein